MSSPTTLAAGFVISIISIALSGCAADARLQVGDANAACKQARSEANHFYQLAGIDDGANPTLDAAVSRACNTSSL